MDEAFLVIGAIMARLERGCLTLAGCLTVLTMSLGQQPVVPGTSWKLDELTLTNGGKFQGLLISDTPSGVRFMTIRHVPGRPTITLTTYFPRSEVRNLKLLAEADRALLKDRIADLDPSGRGEQTRMESIELKPVDWLGKAQSARRYEAEHFVVISTAPEEVTRRAIVRLEQIFAAFLHLLPPRHEMGRPTTVIITGDLDQYQKLLGRQSGQLLNSAVFDPGNNRVVCGTDLRRLGDELTRTREHHHRQLAEADQAEKELRALYKSNKPELDRYLQQLQRERNRIAAAERENDRTFDQATRRVFAMLYHEAFHAYVANAVYPGRKPGEPGTGELPRWLNEGLAQLFENPIIEAGELRVDHPDPLRLKKVQESLRAHQQTPGTETVLIPLSDLFKAGQSTFLTGHANQQEASDKTYLTSWALLCYLTFDRRVLGTAALDRYVRSVNDGTDPVIAFEELVGMKLDEFTKAWHKYLLAIRPDASLQLPNK